MKQLRERWSWSSAIAPVVFGVGLAVAVTACGNSDSPASPSGLGNPQSAAVDTTPTPSPTPTPTPPPPTPTPTPGGGEGCTPGYWKQEQHFDSWVGYSPNQAFDSVFADAFGSATLLEVLGLNGGGLNALGRHAVAALLSASSDDVDYDLTVQQVIDAFNAAYASGDYETQKNIFDRLNNQGCPLD